MGLGGYYMLSSIAETRGMDSIGNTSGRDVEFDQFLEQMSPRGWAFGNGLGTGFSMNGYDPTTGAAAKVLATGLHYSTLTPVLKFGVILTISIWFSLLYASAKIFITPGDMVLKAVIFVPINYLIVYSISGGWLSSAYLAIGIALGILFNFRAFAETAAAAAQPNQPDGRPLLHRRHRHL
jgi:hypothetical protein